MANESELAIPQVAIIGTEGSGKTVLISTLAHRFGAISQNGLFLNPLDNQTLKYVESQWGILSRGEWPAGTPMGQLVELKWRLHCNHSSSAVCELRLVDCSGQDLRLIFSRDEADAASNLPEHLQKLVEYCRSADIVICLVNIKDFLGENNQERRIDNQIVIKAALDRLSNSSTGTRWLCLLFTQIDQYQEILRQYGSWKGVAQQHLPYVHGAHLTKDHVMIGAAAAVNDTTVAVDSDGKPRRIPARNFGSKGLNELTKWLVETAASIAVQREEQRKLRAEAEQRDETERWKKRADEIHRQKQIAREKRRRKIRITGIAGAILLALTLIVGLRRTSPPSPRAIPFRLTVGDLWWIDYGNFLWTNDDICFRNDFRSFALHDIQLEVIAMQGDKFIETKNLEWSELSPGETARWPGTLSIAKGSGSKSVAHWSCHELSCEIVFGRFRNEIRFVNRTPVVLTNIAVTVSVTKVKDGQFGAKSFSFTAPTLSPDSESTWPLSESVSSTDSMWATANFDK
jgi:hypothetical protein